MTRLDDRRPSRREPRGEEALAAVVLLFGIAGLVICGAAWWQGHAASATTDAEVAPVLVGAVVDTALVPGATAEVVLTVDNPSHAPVRVRRVELVALTVDHEHLACRTADFTMPEVHVDEVVPPQAVGHRLQATGGLAFASLATSQDACQGASLSLYLEAR